MTRSVEVSGLRYGSVCSGIEAATVAWHPLGWRAQFVSEIDAFPCALLSHYYPSVPNLGDMTRFQEWPDAVIDVLVGGTPCQAFSVAGLRKGLADPRGQLTLTYLAIAARYRPAWLVWENVPGALSIDGGRAFGSFLGGLGELGYGWAYRVLDAQYFDLAQRRPRVFVVASARGWAGAAAVLFEPESLRGDLAPSREAREDIAGSLEARAGGGGFGTDFSLAGGLQASAGGADENDAADGRLIARCVTAREGSRQDYETETLVAAPLSAGSSPNSNAAAGKPCHPLASTAHAPAIAFDARQSDVCLYGEKSAPLDTDGHTIGIHQRMAVRRLTPRECERLQGFPDNYTLIPFRGQPAKDTPRYKALGNSMPVPVMRWIGERIELVESVAQEMAA